MCFLACNAGLCDFVSVCYTSETLGLEVSSCYFVEKVATRLLCIFFSNLKDSFPFFNEEIRSRRVSFVGDWPQLSSRSISSFIFGGCIWVVSRFEIVACKRYWVIPSTTRHCDVVHQETILFRLYETPWISHAFSVCIFLDKYCTVFTWCFVAFKERLTSNVKICCGCRGGDGSFWHRLFWSC